MPLPLISMAQVKSHVLKEKINVLYFSHLMVVYMIICSHNCVFTLKLNTKVMPLETEQSMTKVVSSLRYSLCICIVSKNESGILRYFLDTFHRGYFPVLVSGEEIQYLESCSSVFIFSLSKLKSFDKIVSSIKKQTLYLINHHYGVKLLISEESAKKISLSKVIFVSLQDGKLYKSNKLFLLPPYMIESSFEEAIEHQTVLSKVDLQGEVLKIATMDYFPFFSSKDSKFFKDKKVYNVNGIDDDVLKSNETVGIEDLLMKELAQQLNFTIDYDIYNARWGVIRPNGTWVSGIGKAMLDGNTDLAIGNFWETTSIHSAMDFGPSLSNNKMVFMVERPTQLDLEFGVVFKIFNSSVWLAFLAAFVLVAAFYWLSFKVNRKIHYDEGFDRTHNKSIWGSLMDIYGHFLSTTCQDPSRNCAARLILVSWCIFSLLLRASLSSGIVTRYTLPSFSPRIDSIKQLVEGQYYWTAQFYSRFNNSRTKQGIFDFTNQWQFLFEKKYEYLEAEEVQMRAFKDRKMTFPTQLFNKNIVVINTYGLVRTDNAIQKYRLTKESIRKSHTSFGVKKHSPILHILTITALRIIESGLLDYWGAETLRKWKEYDYRHVLQEHDTTLISEAKPIKTNKILNEFYLLLIGLIISLLVFILELVHWSYKSRLLYKS